MPLPRFIDLDGRWYLWREPGALRQTRTEPRSSRPLYS